MPQCITQTWTREALRSLFGRAYGRHLTRVASVLHALQSPPPCQQQRERPKCAPTSNVRRKRRKFMLHYAVVFFVIAIIAAIFGFGGIAAGAAGIAKILFVVFLIGAIITFLVGRSRV